MTNEKTTETNPTSLNFPAPETISDPTSAPRRDNGLPGLFAALKGATKEERRYRLKRLGVIALGLGELIALIVFALWLKGIFTFSGESAGSEFEGPFVIQCNVSSEYSALPGGPPILRASSIPAPSGKRDGVYEAVTVFELPVNNPAIAESLYAEFVSPLVAFIFIDTIYAVTTNGGHSWEVVTVTDPGAQGGLPVWIDGVMLDEQGQGFLFPPGVQNLDSAWQTENFGLTWSPPDIAVTEN